MGRGDDRREVVISVRLSQDEERVLRRESERQGIPMSTLARLAIARQYGGTTPVTKLFGSFTTSGMGTVETGFGPHEIQQAATITMRPIIREPVPD